MRQHLLRGIRRQSAASLGQRRFLFHLERTASKVVTIGRAGPRTYACWGSGPPTATGYTLTVAS